jgi:hypothetical protein
LNPEKPNAMGIGGGKDDAAEPEFEPRSGLPGREIPSTLYIGQGRT